MTPVPVAVVDVYRQTLECLKSAVLPGSVWWAAYYASHACEVLDGETGRVASNGEYDEWDYGRHSI